MPHNGECAAVPFSLNHAQLFATPWTVVYGILQARILEWVAFPLSRGSSQPRNQTKVSCIAGGFFTNWAIREAKTVRKTDKYAQRQLPNALSARRVIFQYKGLFPLLSFELNVNEEPVIISPNLFTSYYYTYLTCCCDHIIWLLPKWVSATRNHYFYKSMLNTLNWLRQIAILKRKKEGCCQIRH